MIFLTNEPLSYNETISHFEPTSHYDPMSHYKTICHYEPKYALVDNKENNKYKDKHNKTEKLYATYLLQTHITTDIQRTINGPSSDRQQAPFLVP
jgi:hypothetical protein